MVCLVRSFLADYDTAASGFPLRRPLSDRSDEEASSRVDERFISGTASFHQVSTSPTHDGIFAFCRAAPCSVGRADPGRALSRAIPALATVAALLLLCWTLAQGLGACSSRPRRGGARGAPTSPSARARQRAAFRRAAPRPCGRSERRAQQSEHDADWRRRALPAVARSSSFRDNPRAFCSAKRFLPACGWTRWNAIAS